MTQQSFAEYIEMSPASLSSIFNGRTKPTLNIVEAIKRKFPDISTDWLMFGVGSMFSADKTSVHANGNKEDLGDGLASASADGNTPSSSSVNGTPTPSGSISLAMPHANGKAGRQDGMLDDSKFIDRHQRKITEIRVYFDDLTFETFVPSSK